MLLKRSKLLFALVALLASAYSGQAICLRGTGMGQNYSCWVMDSCGSYMKGIYWQCIEEQCGVNWGDGCWPANFYGCAFFGCVNPFTGNCTPCATEVPHA